MKAQIAGRKRAKGKPTAGEEIIASLKEAVRWARGETVGVRITTVPVPEVDVRRVRRRLKLSQTQFAARFGFAPASVRNWEQGRTRPHGPARILLAVIAKHPEAVQDALHRS
jgi:putative transcriptional regulator